MDNRIWCVIRPNYKKDKITAIGICGTGFFISNKAFVTAHHVLNNSCFQSNSNYNNTEILLLNSDGRLITINLNSKIEYYPDKDITKVEFEKEDFNFFEIDLDIKEQDDVRNIGFPSNKINEIITESNGSFKINKIFEEQGKILKIIPNFSSNSNDVNIKTKPVIITTYTSSIGFSGGPLLKGNKVIGLMSMIIPQKYENYSGKSVAISSFNFI